MLAPATDALVGEKARAVLEGGLALCEWFWMNSQEKASCSFINLLRVCFTVGEIAYFKAKSRQSGFIGWIFAMGRLRSRRILWAGRFCIDIDVKSCRLSDTKVM